MRRIHVKALAAGELELPASQAHHLRDVLRLEEGTAVEAFDDSGAVAEGVLAKVTPGKVIVRIEKIQAARSGGARLTIAAAVPKGNRADWMIEKLSELGVDVFIPLATKRSVVVPGGKSKFERWERLASESAEQSRRSGVMRIDPLVELGELMKSMDKAFAWYLSPEARARPIVELASEFRGGSVMLFIGPEGGWTTDEIDGFGSAGVGALRLTDSILRVETAAVAAAAVVQSILSKASSLTSPTNAARIGNKGTGEHA